MDTDRSQDRVYFHTVSQDENGASLRGVLLHGMGFSGGLLSRMCWNEASGVSVTVDGAALGFPLSLSRRCRAGELIRVDMSPFGTPAVLPCKPAGGVEVLYEDAYYLAVCKPSGLQTHPSRGQADDALSLRAAAYLAEHGPAAALHPLNRLDRHTSGIVLFAKDPHAADLGIQALAAGRKTYLGVACGAVEREEIIDLPIARLSEDGMRRGVREDGQAARTRLRPVSLSAGGDMTLLELLPETGRTHQLRVHLLAAGHPLIGDRLYFTSESRTLTERLGIDGQLLHACRLMLPYPLPCGGALDIRSEPAWKFPPI